MHIMPSPHVHTKKSPRIASIYHTASWIAGRALAGGGDGNDRTAKTGVGTERVELTQSGGFGVALLARFGEKLSKV